MRHEVKFDYPLSVHFRCMKCGICCGDTKEKNRHVILLKTEAEQIAKTIQKPIRQFSERIKEAEPYKYEMKKRAEDGKCVFLQNNCCTIYPIRPLVCRFYPFELNCHAAKYSFHFTKECQGIGKGKILNEDFFRRLLRLALARHRIAEDSSGKR